MHTVARSQNSTKRRGKHSPGAASATPSFYAAAAHDLLLSFCSSFIACFAAFFSAALPLPPFSLPVGVIGLLTSPPPPPPSPPAPPPLEDDPDPPPPIPSAPCCEAWKPFFEYFGGLRAKKVSFPLPCPPPPPADGCGLYCGTLAAIRDPPAATKPPLPHRLCPNARDLLLPRPLSSPSCISS